MILTSPDALDSFREEKRGLLHFAGSFGLPRTFIFVKIVNERHSKHKKSKYRK
jgi:hypothetical protein